jgi:hypothetical protein
VAEEIVKNLYDAVFDAVVKRWEKKYLDVGGGYIEK